MKSAYFLVPLSVEAKAPNPPAGWTWTLLTTVAKLESGHTPSRRHPEWWGGEIPWISLPDIRFLDGKVALETVEYVNQDGLPIQLAQAAQPPREAAGHDWRRRARCLSLADRR
jgi:hypothetical protein